MSELTVKIAFDEKSKVWGTWDSQVPGLTAFDSSKDGLLDQIEKVTPLLLHLSAKSTRLPPDKEYEVVVIEQTPPVFVEQPSARPSYRLRSFHFS
jgi:hypothetical protein